jgi:hypothetical protein
VTIVNKKEIIQSAFRNYNLTEDQKDAIRDTVDGYVKLIACSNSRGPSGGEVKIFVDLIKSNLVNTLNVIEHARN